MITIPDNHNTLEELLPWERFAVLVPPEQLPRLPQLLRSISPQRREEMRAALRCVWRRLWYSSVYGPCFGESASTDAFDGLLRVLAARVAPSGELRRGPARAHAPDVDACFPGGRKVEAV